MVSNGGHRRCAVSENPEQTELGHGQAVFGRGPSQNILDGEAELDQGVHQFRGPDRVRWGGHRTIVDGLLRGTKYMIGDTK